MKYETATGGLLGFFYMTHSPQDIVAGHVLEWCNANPTTTAFLTVDDLGRIEARRPPESDLFPEGFADKVVNNLRAFTGEKIRNQLGPGTFYEKMPESQGCITVGLAGCPGKTWPEVRPLIPPIAASNSFACRDVTIIDGNGTGPRSQPGVVISMHGVTEAGAPAMARAIASALNASVCSVEVGRQISMVRAATDPDQPNDYFRFALRQAAANCSRTQETSNSAVVGAILEAVASGGPETLGQIMSDLGTAFSSAWESLPSLARKTSEEMREDPVYAAKRFEAAGNAAGHIAVCMAKVLQ
jgi:hypothetical protein